MVSWDTYRIPVDFEIVLPKPLPGYQNENTLFRQMVARFLPLLWAKRVIVLGNCAFASRENMQSIQRRNKEDKHCQWGFVFGIARTWKQSNDKSLKNSGHSSAASSVQKDVDSLAGSSTATKDFLDIYQTNNAPSYRRCHDSA